MGSWFMDLFQVDYSYPLVVAKFMDKALHMDYLMDSIHWSFVLDINMELIEGEDIHKGLAYVGSS